MRLFVPNASQIPTLHQRERATFNPAPVVRRRPTRRRLQRRSRRPVPPAAHRGPVPRGAREPLKYSCSTLSQPRHSVTSRCAISLPIGPRAGSEAQGGGWVRLPFCRTVRELEWLWQALQKPRHAVRPLPDENTLRGGPTTDTANNLANGGIRLNQPPEVSDEEAAECSHRHSRMVEPLP